MQVRRKGPGLVCAAWCLSVYETQSSGQSWQHLHICELPLDSQQVIVEPKMGNFHLPMTCAWSGCCVCVSDVAMPVGLHGWELWGPGDCKPTEAAVLALRDRADVGVEWELERASMTMGRDEQKKRADLRRWICLVGVKGGMKSCEGKEQGAKGSDSSCPERTACSSSQLPLWGGCAVLTVDLNSFEVCSKCLASLGCGRRVWGEDVVDTWKDVCKTQWMTSFMW